MISALGQIGNLPRRPAPVRAANSSSVPRVIDLCCGLGGLSLAARQLGMRVVAGVDTNAAALKTFSRNFPEAKAIAGSVRSKAVLAECKKLLARRTGHASPAIILSGPPCQGFSAAGSRDPKDRRNKVLVAVAQAIAELKPDCAVIENVSMVLASKYGKRLSRFERILASARYRVQRVLLDASEFGVPQKRRRAFFLVTRKSLALESLQKELEARKSACDGAEKIFAGLPAPAVRPDDYDDEQIYGMVYNHLAMLHSKAVKTKIAAIEPGTGPMSYRRLHPSKPSNTLFSGHRAPPAHFLAPRSITVREAARLQGFPDDFRVYGAFSNQMERVTNAVPPPLTRAVLQGLTALLSLC
jgi:DNA (cytosine-5)-methyltransferase 1